MNTIGFAIGSLADRWADLMIRISWHGGVTIAVALGICCLLTAVPPWVKSWIWRVVYAKFLVALLIIQPIAIPILAPQPAVVSAGTIARGSAQGLTTAVPGLLDTSQFGDSILIAAPASDLTSPAVELAVAESSPVTLPSLTTVLFSAWIVGVITCIALLIRHRRQLALIDHEPITSHEIVAQRDRIADEIGLSKLPWLAVSRQVPSPMLIGTTRPTILLPLRVLHTCSSGEIEMILRHEMAHIRRHDLLWGWLATAVEILFFFHPLVWCASRRSRLVREMACDHMAIHGVSKPASYAMALVHVAELSSEHKFCCRTVGAACIFESSKSLSRRLIAMKQFRRHSMVLGTLYGMAILAAGAFGVLPWQPVSRAADDNSESVEFGENMGFEAAGDDGFPLNWYGGGNGSKRTVDSMVKHSGDGSARIKSTEEKGSGTFTQCHAPGEMLGKRVRFSGYIKTKNIERYSGLWMRVDKNETPVAFDNMTRRPIKGDTDWTQCEVVLDVPADATKICFGFLVVGRGTAWGDDLKFSILGPAGKGAKSTDMGIGKGYESVGTPRNLNFEKLNANDYPEHWFGGGKGYRLSADGENAQNGGYAAKIESVGDGNFGTFTQSIAATEYLGKRLKYTGYLKTKEAGSVGLWMRVDGGKNAVAFDNMGSRRVKGTTDWKQYSVILDVPKEAKMITFGFLSSADGIAWADDLAFETVDPDGAGNETTAMNVGAVLFPPEPRNMDFELVNGDRLTGWGGGGKGYELIADDKNARTGGYAAKIENVGDGAFGTFTQAIVAKKYLGKRLKYTGYLKTKEAGGVGLWMRVDQGKNTVGFDNMSQRQVKGTTDWRQYSVILDVPKEATTITFGFLSTADGIAWADDLAFETVDPKVAGNETTAMNVGTVALPAEPLNMDFESINGDRLTGWSGGGKEAILSFDDDVKHSGVRSGHISRDDGLGMAIMTQVCKSDMYAGKRVKLSGFLKAKGVNWAGLCLRTADQNRPLSGEDIASVRGNTDWKLYEVTLDVPPEATSLVYGFVMNGAGSTWCDDLRLEIVE